MSGTPADFERLADEISTPAFVDLLKHMHAEMGQPWPEWGIAGNDGLLPTRGTYRTEAAATVAAEKADRRWPEYGPHRAVHVPFIIWGSR